MKKTIFLGLSCLLLVSIYKPSFTESDVVPIPAPKHVKHLVRRSAPVRVLSASQVAIQAYLEEVFPDVPRMLPIIRDCESGLVQFDPSGAPLLSPTNDVGVMQVNKANWAQAKALGLDIFNSYKDNIKMGRVIYDQQGIGAWTCSKKV